MENDKVLELVKELVNKVPASTQTATETTSPGGIYSVCGLDPTVISAYVRPFQSIASVLPLLPTADSNPQFASFTGFTADDGTQPALVCDDAPTADMKSCILTAQFGLTRFDTKTIEPGAIIQRTNRGHFQDLTLAGQVLGLEKVTPQGMSSEDVVKLSEMAAMVTAAAQAERKLVNEFWQGVVTATNQFPGLDVQIATAQVDSKTNQACPALDSDVKDFTYNEVGGTGKDIAEYLEMVEFYLRNNAEAAGLQVEWVIAMRPQLLQRLSQVWPIKYNTIPDAIINQTDFTRITIDGRENTRERDRIRSQKVLTVNGTDYQVIPDIGIFESNSTNNANLAAGQFSSSIYFVPITANGVPVTFREYLDYRLWDSQLVHPDRMDFWTDDGIYSWALENQKWCHKFALRTEQRIVLRSPQLAGRIDNVMYEPLQHLREPDPSSAYHFDGGVSLRGEASDYAVWK